MVAGGQRGWGLLHVGRLPRQRRLVHFQRVRFNEADIGGDDVAGFEQHHVAGDQVGGSHFQDLAVAQHLGLAGGHLLEGFHGFFGPVFLNKADDGIDHDNGQDDVSRFPFAHQA